MQELEYTLCKNTVFNKFDKINLSRLCQYVKQINVEHNEVIFSINDKAGDYYYLIASGEVNIINEQGISKTISAGDSFGDECIIGFDVFLSTAVAKDGSVIFAVEKNFIIDLYEFDNKEFANRNFLNNISKKNKNEYPDKSIVTTSNYHYLKIVLGWFSVIILPVIIVYLLFNLDNPPNRSQALLIYIFLSSIVMWTLRLVPEFVPAIFLLLGMILLSLGPSNVVLSGFHSDAFFLAISLSALGAIIGISGLSYRIMLYLFKFNTNNKIWLHFVLFISGTILTPIIPSANGRANIIYPLFKEALSLFKIERGSIEYQRLMASTIGGFSLLSPIFLTSKSINLLALGMLSTQDQYSFQFYYWLISASLVGIFLLLFYWFFIWIFFRNKQINYINNNFLKAQNDILGRISLEEFFAILSVVIFGVIMFTSNIHNLQVSWLAMLLVFFLFIMGVLKRKNFNKSIDWDFLIFLSALLGFANTMNYLDVHVWMGHYTTWIADIIYHQFIKFVFILAAVIFALRLILPINVTVILMASILVPISANTGVSPWLVIFIVLLMSESYTYNFSASYVMQFTSLLGDSFVCYRSILIQVAMYFIKIIAIIASIPYWNYLGILS